MNRTSSAFYDTAHAYAFGYDIANKVGREGYIQLLGQTVGFDNIELIHINDTESTLKSRHDIHCRMGRGNIGIQGLQEFAIDERLLHIPLLLELPAIDEIDEQEDLKIVRSWQQL